MISAVGPEGGSCPDCGKPSKRRHSRYFRHLQDLPVQGAVVTVKMRMSRWRCTNGDCERLTFADRPSESVSPYARRTGRIAELVHLFGHGVGGKPGERLLKRLGMPVSDDTILRQLKRRVAARCGAVTVRVAGIDDWSWRRGCSYGTIVVDLERRVVVDVLADRTAAGTADWLRAHPEVEIISRDRSGLCAQGGATHRRDRSLIAFICFKICESRLKPNSAASTGRRVAPCCHRRKTRTKAPQRSFQIHAVKAMSRNIES